MASKNNPAVDPAGLNPDAASKLAKDGWGDAGQANNAGTDSEESAAPANGKKESLPAKFDRLVDKLKIHGIHFS